MADYVGQQLGNYRLLRLLGVGASASVYLGEHQYLERPAAVKVLHVQMEPGTHAAFLREAQTIARLDHPHIVRVLDFGIHDQIPYLVMDYTPNGTLRTRYPRGTSLTCEQVVTYVKQIALALDYAHEHSVIHRDVKPENILLNARGEVVLSDFGIAIVQDTLASPSQENMAGTPLYMAPEQIQHQTCAASDQYALGVIVYEWLCGQSPFPGPGMAVFGQHLYQAPPSLRAHLPHLPPVVEKAVFRALAKDPAQRFPTVKDFAVALEQACLSLQTSIKAGPSNPAASEQRFVPPLQTPMPSTFTPPRPGQVISQRPFPISLMSICAPADQPYLEQWEAQLRPLAGLLTVWSEYHIPPGADRQQQINEHLNRADLIILLVSADFFDSDDCIALMERALQRRQHEGAYVVPMLLRPVEWDASPTAALTYIPSNGRPVTAWMDRDEAFDWCVRDLRRLLGHRMPPRPEQPLSGALRTRQVLLRNARSFWIEGVLNHSLHDAALLALGLEARPDAVADPWHLEFQQPEATPLPLPAGTRVTQVYDKEQGELLILGAPGAGKTTLLLELARDLLERAERDEQHPIPVVFNLSSWAIKRRDLADWLVEELNSRYQIPHKLAQAFVEDNQIIPLLDGLDEVAERERTECIAAINAYRREHGLWPLVVCSRSTDYLAQTERVRLGSAVMVRPLTPRQVIDFLSAAGPQMEGLSTALRHDHDLQELAITPLLLNILILTYQGVPLNQIAPLGTLPAKQRQIFATYVQRMLARRSASSHYITEQTLPWLSFLAQMMKRRAQTVFYIESIQPDWLIDQRMRRTYSWLAVYLPYMLIGTLVSLAFYPIFFFRELLEPYLTEVILLGGLLGWLLGGRSTVQQPLAGSGARGEGLSWHWLLLQLGVAALIGIGVGLSFWAGNPGDPLRGPFAGLSFGVCCLLLMLLLRKSTTRRAPVQGTSRPRNVALSAIFVGLLVGLSNVFVIGLHEQLLTRLAYGFAFLLIGGLSCWLLSVLLSKRNADVQPVDKLIWTWQSLSSSLFARRHVKRTLQTTGIGLLFFSAIIWLFLKTVAGALFFGLLLGAISGLCYWLLFGIFRGVTSATIDDRLRAIPGQGIRQSMLNALRYGLVVAILVGLGVQPLFDGKWVAGLIIGLSVGLLTALFNGGLPFLRHCILRILLWRSGMIPWDYPRFLDAAAERMLLNKVGGGYIFMHRLLLDYLATLLKSSQTEPKQERFSTIARPAAPPHPIAPVLPCGHERRPNARYCSVCGAAVPLPTHQLEE